LKKFIADFPKSEYVPRAMYWLAISRLNSKQILEGAEILRKLVKEYPESNEGKQAENLLKRLKSRIEKAEEEKKEEENKAEEEKEEDEGEAEKDEGESEKEEREKEPEKEDSWK
jgi:outer membrane protein assembly factor BamD (BamD/ComL family)